MSARSVPIKPALKSSSPARAWQRMLSGRRLDLLDPSPLDIEIEDIAHGLARVARWNGQTHGVHVFSVAQHALLVEVIAAAIAPGCDPRLRLTILLHDGAEYVIGDIISPFKAVLAESYKAVEQRILGAIFRRFGLPAVPAQATRQLLKRADQIAAFHEATRLAGFEADEALRLFGRPSLTLQPRVEASIVLPETALALLQPMPTQEAEAAFLARFHELDKGPALDKAPADAARPMAHLEQDSQQ